MIMQEDISDESKKIILDRYSNFRNSQAGKIVEVFGVANLSHIVIRIILIQFMIKNGRLHFRGD